VLKGKVQRWLVQKKRCWPLSRPARPKEARARWWCCCSQGKRKLF
jgi:hypothetical protein